MIEGLRVLGLIGARGGSKGIPGKNIRSLLGKPLIAYAIEAGLQSKYIDEVVVTTDSLEIAAISEQYGASVPFIRPDYLASDTSKTIEALTHACETLNSMGNSFDIMVLLQPTSPLRTAVDVDEAIEFFIAHGRRGVVSVSEVSENPILVRSMNKENELKQLVNCESTIRRQDLPSYYRINGAIYINNCNELNNDLSLNDNPLGFVIARSHAVDIDAMSDFEEAERLMSRR